MAKRYRKTFEFCDTQEQAQAFCDRINASYSSYARKHYKAFFTPWSSSNGQEHKFIVWYSI